MKIPIVFLMTLSAATVVVASAASPSSVHFTYQGHVERAGSAVDGALDFEVLLFDRQEGGQLLGEEAFLGQGVVDGDFSLDLDLDGLPPEATWLEIQVRDPETGELSTLSPRQRLSNDLDGSTCEVNHNVQILGSGDTAPSGGGYLVLGGESSANISIDQNEIMARANGQISNLYLNNGGGTVIVGGDQDVVGNLSVTGSLVSNGTAIMDSNLIVGGNSQMFGNLTVAGKVDLGYELVEHTWTNPSGPSVGLYCPAGKIALGGGCNSHQQIEWTGPWSNGWGCGSDSAPNWITAYAICARVAHPPI